MEIHGKEKQRQDIAVPYRGKTIATLFNCPRKQLEHYSDLRSTVASVLGWTI